MGDRHQFRADWHDYNDGIFFVTICCADKQHYFGEIQNGKMQLSTIGNIVQRQIEDIPHHFTECEIWNYVVMPNHIHFIVSIAGSLPKTSAPTYQYSANNQQNLGCLKQRNHEAPVAQYFHHNNRLSVITRCLKGGVTRQAGRLGLRFEWQSRYHEHIIRNQASLDNIMNYIDSNVENWSYDRFNASATASTDETVAVGTLFKASASAPTTHPTDETAIVASAPSYVLRPSTELNSSASADALKSVPTCNK